MGFDLAAVIVEEFAMLARLVEECANARARGNRMPVEDLDRLSNLRAPNLPEEYFDPAELDLLREADEGELFNEVWHDVDAAMSQLTEKLRVPNLSDSEYDAEIAAASRVICAQLARVRVASGGRLNHPVLQKLWLTFRCDS